MIRLFAFNGEKFFSVEFASPILELACGTVDRMNFFDDAIERLKVIIKDE